MRRSSPGAQVSPPLPPPPSISLLNFTFFFFPPTISSFAVSYTLMVFLLISLPAVPVFHLPPHNQIAWAVTAQIHPPPQSTPTLHSPTIPISSFTLALTLSFYRTFALNRDSPESPGGTLCNSRERERLGYFLV